MEDALPNYSANEPAIHGLVDDILEYIFLLNATLPDSEHATTVASSQVCSRWRSIALNCHTIWGRIIDYRRHSLKWIETLLDRSNPSLLDFGSRNNCVYLEDDRQGVLELVFNHIDRLRIFNLGHDDPDSIWELVCSRFLQLPAPNLEFMHVSFVAGHLTHPLFDNHAPNLQNLGLLHCSVDFTSPVLTSLTDLSVRDIDQLEGDAVPTVLDWLNILGGMPSLRWVTLVDAISSAPTNDICPVIHLDALDMLSVDGPFHECVTLVKHLIMPPRCGLRLRCDHAHLGLDQRQLWAVIEKKIDSWTKNASNRRLIAKAGYGFVGIRNLLEDNLNWGTKAREYWRQKYPHLLDPVMSIELNSHWRDGFPLFLSLFTLFEWTFFDTTYLQHSIDYSVGAEAFLPLVDSFRGFVNLETLYVVNESLLRLLFPLLQQANSVLLPALKSLNFHDVMFGRGSDTVLRVADFLQWRREQGFPVEKIGIERCGINRKYILTHIQDTVVEIDNSNYPLVDSDTEE
jgi:hypothetical protein